MHKLITAIASTGLALTLATTVYAAKAVTVRIEQPKSPVNQSSFTLGFVALDINGRDVTVKCFKKGPSDASFTQFDTTKTFADGGNSGTCSVSGLSGEGTYSFRVEASAGDGTGDDADSEEASVTYDTTGPGSLRDYSKTKTNSCEYTIRFRTAEDNGQTVKVELYRSESVPFTAGSGTWIQTIPVGSNETKNTTDTPPNCSKTYYYAVRAFDAAGNGSGLVGDNVQDITVITPTGSPSAGSGAIPVSGTGGNILGAESDGATGASGTTGENGQVAGESSMSATPSVTPAESPNFIREHPKRSLAIGGLLVIVGALVYYLWKSRQVK